MPTKSVVSHTLETDRALIVNAYGDLLGGKRDYKAIREALQRRIKNKAEFHAIRQECFIDGALAYMRRTNPKATREMATLAITKAGVNANLPDDKKRSMAEHLAFKSASNAWDYLLKHAGFVTMSAQGGKRKAGAKASTANEAKVDTETKANPPTNAPVTIPSLVIPKAKGAADLGEYYMALKAHLVKVQAANVKAYDGDAGSKLLAVHTELMNALNKLG